MRNGTPITVRLDDYQISQIDRIARQRESSRSAVTRQLIDNALLEGENKVGITLDKDTYDKVSSIARTCKLDIDMTLSGMIDFLVSQTFMSYLRK